MKLIIITILVILMITIDYCKSSDENDERFPILYESTFNLKFNQEIISNSSECLNKLYNFQINTCVYINDGCLNNTFLNILKIKNNNPDDNELTIQSYSIELYNVELSNQIVGCNGNFTNLNGDIEKIKPTNLLEFKCIENENISNNNSEQFKLFNNNQINVTCLNKVRVNYWYEYSYGSCRNLKGQLNKCSYIPFNSCNNSFTSILFSNQSFTPTVQTFSNGFCDNSNSNNDPQQTKLSCSINSDYELKCYNEPFGIFNYYNGGVNSLIKPYISTIIIITISLIIIISLLF